MHHTVNSILICLYMSISCCQRRGYPSVLVSVIGFESLSLCYWFVVMTKRKLIFSKELQEAYSFLHKVNGLKNAALGKYT